MPRLIRQVLVERIQESPDLAAFLTAFPTATGLAVAYLDQPGSGDPSAPIGSTGLEARLHRDASGRKSLVAFWHLLTESAVEQPAVRAGVSGLSAAAVPLRANGQTLGYLVTAGFLAAPASPLELNRIRHLLAREGIKLNADEIASLARESPLVPADRQASIILLLQWAADRLVSRLDDRVPLPTPRMPALVERVFKTVHAEFAAPIGIEYLARRLNVSEAHLSRTFHHATGLRIVEYIARFRAERAHEKLIATSWPIAKVAAACGFQSTSQFNRVFRARYGRSPSTVRENSPDPVQ